MKVVNLSFFVCNKIHISHLPTKGNVCDPVSEHYTSIIVIMITFCPKRWAKPLELETPPYEKNLKGERKQHNTISHSIKQIFSNRLLYLFTLLIVQIQIKHINILVRIKILDGGDEVFDLADRLLRGRRHKDRDLMAVVAL